MKQKEFNWEEFLASYDIAVYCNTEEQAIDFCKKMHEHWLQWSNGESYLDKTNWDQDEEGLCYTSYGSYSNFEYYAENDYTILKWSDYTSNK